MSFSWVRPKQAPDDEIEVFSLGEPEADEDTGAVLEGHYELLKVSRAEGQPRSIARATSPPSRSSRSRCSTRALAAVGDFFNQEARLAARNGDLSATPAGRPAAAPGPG